MQRPETMLSTREILNRLYDRMRRAYAVSTSSQPGDVEADKKLTEHIEVMSGLFSKLEYALVQRIKSDVDIDAKSHERLQELERLAEGIFKGKRTDVQKARILYHFAKSVRSKARRQSTKTRGKGIKLLKKTRKDEQKIKKDKIEAAEKIGVKKV